MSLRTPLSNVKGLGSAKEGAHHWWMQRLTSIALLPLTLWLAFSVASFGSMSYLSVVAWMQSPLVAVAAALLVVVLLYHLQLGAQVIIEDYVGGWLRITSLIMLNFACIALAFLGLFSIIKVSLAL
ncbi:MAG: succinate dehydrogenase, hydrophobic membrane anchor protein [Gammaproteobacteria bacterium TMED119]|nr:MAG: succinate dehydrogenase, hydrophobic membrane anchor protein [Gammaproteobacteria bacterium TMED119]|tara:strand:- start:16 stop:393 length:378 start_codon:yes stop_codon:yes gene_type:complete